MHNQAFAALLFDMDGLMIDTEALSAQAWRQAGEKLGITLPETVLAGMVGLASDRCADYLQQTLPALDTRDLLQAARQLYHRALYEAPIPLKPGIESLLQWCEARQVPRAVATATQRQLADIKLSLSGLAPYFRHSVCGDEVAHSKPAPDVYLKAAALLEVPPTACIVLEDSPYGAQAALAAGMRVIIVPDMAPAPPQIAKQALAVCQDLLAAQALLADLLNHSH